MCAPKVSSAVCGEAAPPSKPRLLCSHRDNLRSLRREPPRLPLRRELSDCIKDLSSTTEGEITRGCCLHQSVDEHRVKKRSFAFALAYIKCFRTYSVYLSFRHGVLIPLYAVPPPSSEGGEGAPAPRTESPLCYPLKLSPLSAGCPYPSRCSAKAPPSQRGRLCARYLCAEAL